LQKAMEEDPDFAMPIAVASRWFSLCAGQGWSANPAADRAKALELAGKAIERDSQNALALGTYGHLQSFLFHDYDSAMVYFERALAACPNHSLAWGLSSPTLSYIGRAEQAIKHVEQAMRLSPLDRNLFFYYTSLNLANYARGSYEEAVRWGKLSASENPHCVANLGYLAAALAALDRLDEARNVAANLMQRVPDFRLGTFEHTLQPFRDPEISSRYMQHLRKSNLPE
jgi:adenylate cyclase